MPEVNQVVTSDEVLKKAASKDPLKANEEMKVPSADSTWSKGDKRTVSICLVLSMSMAFVNFRYEERNQIPTKVAIVAAAIFACMLLCLAIINYLLKVRLPSGKELVDWGWVMFSFPFAVFFFVYFLYHIYQSYTKATGLPFSSTPIFTVLFFLGMICTGVLFFVYRLKHRFWYGFFEMLVGLSIATIRFYSDVLSASNQIEATPVAIAILTGGIYLMVRGLDNMHQGLEKAQTGLRIMRIFNPPKRAENRVREDWR